MRMVLRHPELHVSSFNRIHEGCISAGRVLRAPGCSRSFLADQLCGRNRSPFAILLVCLAVPAACAQIPELPRPQLPMADKILLGTIAAGRSGDALTTHQFLMAGQDEASLPIWIACSQPNMWTYSMAISAGQMQVSRLLVRRNHIRIARTLEVIHAAFIWNTVATNEEIIPGQHRREVANSRPNPCLKSEGRTF